MILVVTYFFIILLVVIPLNYAMKYFLLLDGTVNASHSETLIQAVKCSAILTFIPISFYCHSLFPERHKVNPETVFISSLAFLCICSFFLSEYIFK